MEFWILMLLVAMGTYAGYVYRQKGRSAVTGFLAGFVLGPIGVFLALFSSSAWPSCAYCREQVHPRASVCSHCGRVVRGKKIAPPAARTDYRVVGLLVTLAFVAAVAWLTSPMWLP